MTENPKAPLPEFDLSKLDKPSLAAAVGRTAKNRLVLVEEGIEQVQHVLENLDGNLANAFQEVSNRELQIVETLAAIALTVEQLRNAVNTLIADPSNPASAAAAAREIMEAPLDFTAFDGGNDVAGEPAGDPPGDA